MKIKKGVDNSKRKAHHMLDKLFIIMLIFVPIALAAKFLGFSPIVIFFLSALAIIPLAKFIGESTEEISSYTGSGLGGLLNATFGNATEIIISIFAIKEGLIEVVKASLTGSIIANLLLITGCSTLAGGIYYKKQKFNITAASISSSTLLLAVIAIIIPAIFFQTSPNVGDEIIGKLSLFVSVAMILFYIASLWFILNTHKHLYTQDIGEHKAKWSKRKSILILIISTLFVAVISEMLVSSIEPVAISFGWTELFIGVIFIAIIGNAAEHISAISAALKNKMDLSLQISIGSATQIAMFVAPLLVLISYFMKDQMSLLFNAFELMSIVGSVLILNFIVQDGESNWLEGLQLLIAYLIIAIAFYFHP